MDTGDPIDIIYLDSKKAFDKVPQSPQETQIYLKIIFLWIGTWLGDIQRHVPRMNRIIFPPLSVSQSTSSIISRGPIHFGVESRPIFQPFGFTSRELISFLQINPGGNLSGSFITCHPRHPQICDSDFHWPIKGQRRK